MAQSPRNLCPLVEFACQRTTLAARQAREYGAVMANTSSPLWSA